jgi:hypothetical protein
MFNGCFQPGEFFFNEEIAADLAKLQKHCTSSVNNSLVTDICDKLKSRNKRIRIADTSAGGWATVRTVFLQGPILLQWKHTSQRYDSRRAKPRRKGG